jgi:peptide/nickel transport system permease protein
MQQVLAALGRPTVVFAGVQTQVCVESTLRDAHAQGYCCVAVEDAVGSHTPALHEATLDNVRFLFGDVCMAGEVLAAWRGGALDAALMRLADGMLALPALPVLVVLAAADTGRIGLPRGEALSDILRIVGLLTLFGWVGVARLARAAALSVLARDYVRAARALGASEGRVLVRHVVPNIAGPVAVATALAVAGAILAESTLSFLGLGIAPPAASWGNMLSNAQDLVFSAPWAAVWPGVMILAAVAGCTLIADGLRRR